MFRASIYPALTLSGLRRARLRCGARDKIIELAPALSAGCIGVSLIKVIVDSTCTTVYAQKSWPRAPSWRQRLKTSRNRSSAALVSAGASAAPSDLCLGE